ncbi:DeoR/GlpR family DNA-binding transcription regulator [Paeniglutamicibacter psychrophenolicus]|uniref:DeoR/GlpR family DNA-binding transcription regulator n=1 Tax=Paeniglutamicibacter psychrophenolicus TaxID=257454 RepID=UPI00278BAB09|nr:DeoR/GlpR family DNA-binding transcription regulator [Paeniglutamicibacter psychrophenolicus]MDQ0094302.1 DeoR/GlpR family transcriptional regulator of sugar metabolism [Paeniglutamicibacter psychrophenolicus]
MTEMLASARQQRILDALREREQVRVTSLAAELGVSEMTVRRDLNALAERGALVKVHGGATLDAAPTSSEPGFTHKLALESGEKLAIAQAAVKLIKPGMSIALNSGTTTYALASQCTGIKDLTVVTNSPRIAEIFYAAANPSQNIILTGGIRTVSDALVGPLALSALGQLHVDVLFLGVHGMTAEDGFTTPNMLEAQTNQAFIKAAARQIIVADHTKWGVTGLCQIVPLSQVDALVTGTRLDEEAKDLLRQALDTLILA